MERRQRWQQGLLGSVLVLLVLACGVVARVGDLVVQIANAPPLWRSGLTAISVLLLGLVLALPAWRGGPRWKAVSRFWLTALVIGAVTGISGQLFVPAENGSALLVQALLLAAALLIVRRTRPARSAAAGGTAAAIAIGSLLSWPWLLLGSGGRLTDWLTALVIGALIGLLIERLVDDQRLPGLAADAAGRERVSGGFALAVGLMLIGLGLGPALALWLPLIALAGSWPLWRLLRQRASAAALGWFAGLSIGLPLALTDADALHPVMFFGPLDGALLMGIAALIQLVLAGLLTLLIVRSRPRAWQLGGAALVVVLTAVIGISGGRLLGGGDRLFVVMRNQADVTAQAAISDPTARRAAVYTALTAYATADQTELRRVLERFGIGYTPYYLTNGLEVDGGLLVRWWLMTRSDVSEVMVSPRLRRLPIAQQPAGGSGEAPAEPGWNLELVGAPRAWELGARGQGVLIGQADSGVDWQHTELRAQYRGVTADGVDHRYNWYDPWQGRPEPADISGHGTHTLGTVLGTTVGVAPEAQWIACANLDRNLGNPALYLDCWQFLFAPWAAGDDALTAGRPELGAQILNNSWGCPQPVEGCSLHVLQPAADALTAAGVFVVGSAGNDGPSCSSLNTTPATHAAVLSVAAVDADGIVAGFSSAGPVDSDGSGRSKPDIAAPGVQVLSAFPGGGYEAADGTSMAGPHVAGAVALLWSVRPDLIGNVEATRQLLLASATPIERADDCGAGNRAGAGLLNAGRAVELALGR